MKYFNKLILISTLSTLLFFFQNCGASFDISKEASSYELIEIDDGDISLPNNNSNNSNNSNKPKISSKPNSQFTNNSLSFFVCILNNNGRSTQLGVLKETFEQNKTPETLCMTKSACLNIVSEFVAVKEARYAVQCEKSKAGVKHISEEELLSLL